MNAAVYALAAIGALYLLLTAVATTLVILAAYLDHDDKQAKPEPVAQLGDDTLEMLAAGDVDKVVAKWTEEEKRRG